MTLMFKVRTNKIQYLILPLNKDKLASNVFKLKIKIISKALGRATTNNQIIVHKLK